MTLSPRLRLLVDALPLEPGMRVLEIGCGPGAAARAVAERIGVDGHLLAVDRSPRAIDEVQRTAAHLIAAGRLTTRCCAVEELALDPEEARFDLAFAFRVGALDGRHPAAGERALVRLAEVLAPGGRLFIDRDERLDEVELPRPTD